MQNIQCARELSDQELETIAGGTGHFSFANANVSASAVAAGGFFHINEGFTATEAFTVVDRNGANASLAFGIAFAVSL
jgi:hypothetical protein